MLKVLEATKEGQGVRKNDFFWTTEGELVGLPVVCHGEGIDGKCGCRRSFVGLDSSKGTTTAKVVRREMNEEEFIRGYMETRKREGWLDDNGWVEVDALKVLRIAQRHRVGTVLEKRGDRVMVRKEAGR